MATDLALVVGARPNFMKAAPLMASIRDKGRLFARLVHTGQHFDTNMSEIFFNQLDMNEPDVYLNIHGGSPLQQISRMVTELEKEFVTHSPKCVVVFGDVNSTLAAAITANKLEITIAHVEAGLRSFDRSMPEEHNRVVTDMLADLLFTPSPDADANLSREGVPSDRVHRVGNIMVDSLLRFKPLAMKLHQWQALGLKAGNYGLVTLHRPGNVDEPETLAELVSALIEIQSDTPILFPVHPRTRAKLAAGGLLDAMRNAGIQVAEPTGYLEFLSLMTQARFVLTDSGGIQEETTMLGIPCLTARDNTERPITIEMGTNQLVGTTAAGILAGYRKAVHEPIEGKKPDLWDGKTAVRIEEILAARF